jgi:hypothetical protein
VCPIDEDYSIEKIGFEEALLENERDAQILFDPA